ncbi:unnamed protein product [Phytophthora fragariaefolia]|uniref:Unnamed protein product n=1 Tax=Phytophthora fragariaefolia TaxID=1490495 RepID=A0A9W6XS37_9STRA|nr:unnamed protein product [Phytophthora fragariaefolia]
MCRSRHINPNTSPEEILVLIRNEHAKDAGHWCACCICSGEYCRLFFSDDLSSSAPTASVITSTVTTPSSPKRTMSLGEYKKARGNTLFARDELEALFDVDSEADMEDDEEDEEASSSRRDDPSVGSRRPHEDCPRRAWTKQDARNASTLRTRSARAAQ